MVCVLILLGASVLAGCSQSPAQHRSEADKYLNHGKYRSALIEFKNVLQQNPHDARARYGLGQAYLALGDTVDAEEQFQRARKLGIPPAKFVVPLARSQVAQKEYDKALQLIKANQGALADQSTQAAVIRGDALLGQGNRSAARAAYSQALAFRDNYVPALVGQARLAVANKDWAAARQHLKKAITADGEDAPAWMLRGQVDAQQHQWKAALAAFDKVASGAAKHHSNNAMRHSARLHQADIEISQGQLDPAEKKIAAILKASPNQPLANFLQARFNVQHHDLADAVDHLQTTLKSAPKYVPALALLGAVKLEQKQTAQAQMYLSSAVALAPNNDQLRQLLADAQLKGTSAQPQTALSSYGGNDIARPKPLKPSKNIGTSEGSVVPDNSLTKLEKRASASPHDAGLQFTLAQALLEQGKAGRALTVLNRLPETANTTGLTRDRLRVAAYLRQKKLSEALKAVKAMVTAHSKDVRAYILASDVYMLVGDNDKAHNAIAKARLIAPHNPHVMLNAAVLAMRSGDHDGAQADFKQLLAQSPKNIQALMGLARLAAMTNNAKDTEQWLQRAVQTEQNYMAPRLALARLYLLEKQPDKAVNVAEKAVKAAPGNARVLNMLAAAQFVNGDRQKALDNFNKAIQSAPHNTALRMHLARAQLAMKQPDAAEKTLKTILQNQPGTPAAAHLLALVQYKQGDHKAAFATADQLGKQSGHEAQATQLKGDLHLLAGEYALADQAYQSLLLAHGSSRVVLNDFRARVKGSIKPPQQPVKRWLKAHPHDLQLRSVLAQWYLQKLKLKAAAHQYQQIVAANGKDATALNNLAWIYSQQNNPKALAIAVRARQAAPGNPQILDTLGWLELQAGQTNQALKNLHDAAAKAPNNPTIQYHLAKAQSRTGHAGSSIKTLKAVLSNKSQFAERTEAEKLLNKMQKN